MKVKYMGAMPTSEYQSALAKGALLWKEYHNSILSALLDETLGTNKKQVFTLVEHLFEYRDKIPYSTKWMNKS